MGSFPGHRIRSHMPHPNFAGYHQKNMYATMKIKEPARCSEDPMQPNKWIFYKNDLNNKFFVVRVLSQLKTKKKKKKLKRVEASAQASGFGAMKRATCHTKGKTKEKSSVPDDHKPPAWRCLEEGSLLCPCQPACPVHSDTGSNDSLSKLSASLTKWTLQTDCLLLLRQS